MSAGCLRDDLPIETLFGRIPFEHAVFVCKLGASLTGPEKFDVEEDSSKT